MNNILQNMVAAFLGAFTGLILITSLTIVWNISHQPKYIIFQDSISPSVACDANGNPKVVTEN